MPLAARLTAVFLAASIVALAIPATTSYADGTDTGDSTVIVTFETNQTNPSAAARAAVTAAGGTDIDRVRPITAKTVAVTLNDTSATEAEAVNSKLESQSAVRAADTSVRFHATQTNDTYFSAQWDLNNASGSTYGVHAEDAWPISRGSGSVVAVIDSGITVHSDLTGSSAIIGGNVVAGYDFISDPRYSNDGDGYDADPTDVVPADEYHGTHVAGTVAAITDNGKGVAGVAPEAKVQPLRVLGVDGGSEEDIIAAIRWAAGLSVSGLASNPTKADVINLSLGGSGTCRFALQSAINDAVAAGTAVVVAAGNGDSQGNGIALSNTMPADCANVIRVTASTRAGGLATYSNFGTTSTPATISAPGGSGTSGSTDSIVSTWHNPDTNTEDYAGMAGTSMAAPHVSGILALMKAANPSLSVAQLTTLLTSTAKPLSSACAASKCGAGIANAPGATAAVTSPYVSQPTWTAATRVGNRLSATTATIPSALDLSWQWMVAGSPVSGATSSTFTPRVSDYGKTVSVSVSATYSGKSGTASSAVVKVAAGEFTKSVSPTISGRYKKGHKLTASAGVWSPVSTKTTYQWLRNGKKISGATGVRHKITKKDKHKKISVRVTVRASGYTTQSATSASHKVK
jgi:serine protease